MKKIIQIFCLLGISYQSFAQNEIQKRVIFIGDAGEINFKQETIIPKAADLIIKDKTFVFYLGDNIYPRGLSLAGTSDEEHTKEILKSQYQPMRSKGAPVYFIPGNHDWDRMGKLGLQKVQAQGNFLAAQNDPLLKMVPENGCPDPVEISISSDLVVIAYDSEWWLFPYEKTNANQNCECSTEEEILDKMEELLYKNRNKTILLASHHPFQTYGVHGGYYSFKDHLFPLTNVKKNLYIPLPVIGSLYPLLRTTIAQSPEDNVHPQYKNLIKKVTNVFDGFPNMLYVAGHEHGLQFNKNKKEEHQIVSGSGAKSSHLKKGKNALFVSEMQGFVTVDYLYNKSLKITYYQYDNHNVKEVYSYSLPYQNKPFISNEALNSDLKDSIIIKANANFDKVGKFHRKLFGENYRKEWAAETKVPIIKLSEFEGGLTPLKRGGGMQTKSLRLVDKNGKQWALRSVNKNSEALLPETLFDTFAEGILDDAVSAQHPYSALMVKPIADALKIPSANPIIGIVAADSVLGVYNLDFANKLNLLEEREPLGKSDNTIKMLEKVNNDNDDTFAAKTFLKSRMLDLLLGDWDRHEDQYRWFNESIDKNKDYRPVPRDRDQVIRLMEGFFGKIVSRQWVMPTLQSFNPKIKDVNYSIFKSDFLNAHPKMQFSLAEWNALSKEFVELVNDDVLEASLKRLPKSSYDIGHNKILATLKARRDAIPTEMEKHYYFINEIIDIKLSNKNELVSIKDGPNKSTQITINKINKEGEVKKALMDKIYPDTITKEVRIYLADGFDTVKINRANSNIKLRIIGGNNEKNFQVGNNSSKINIYTSKNNLTYSGDISKIKTHFKTDTNFTKFVPVNLYNVLMPLTTVGFNNDDGFMIGTGFKYTHQKGFRKEPFNYSQQVLASIALKTGSFKINYKGRWNDAIGKADFNIDATAFAPNNTQNFFGLGNNSEFDNENYSIKHYRARFNLYNFSPTLSWNGKNSEFHIGPKFEYYHFNASDNNGRFIVNNPELINTYDSLTIDKDKLFIGLKASYIKDNRNNKVLPSNGGYFSSDFIVYNGLNSYSKSYAQLKTEFAFYKSFANKSVIIANRIGGGATVGNAAFYQSLFLGGQGNLWGFRKYRFAGEHQIYNNFEARLKLLNIGSYILPGQLGIIGFYDVGKVWAKGYNSHNFHHGVGTGIYYSPAQLLLFQAVAGYSKEGWLPNFTMGFRF